MVRHIVEEMPPTKRPDDPFIREVGDALWGIEGRWSTLRERPRFRDRMISDVQAEYAVRKTRQRDATTRYELRPDGFLHALRMKTPLRDSPIEVLAHGYNVVERGRPEVVANFIATPEEAKKLLALLNRREPLDAQRCLDGRVVPT